VSGAGKLISAALLVLFVSTSSCSYTYTQIEDSFAPAAGRSPTYIVRQLYDMQSGARSGKTTELMKPIAAQLNLQEMIDIAAFMASRMP
jgi:cytochrome c553